MTDFIPIEPGQWVLAFDQPYGPYDRTVAEHLEWFNKRGGGWDSARATELFLVHQVEKVMPKTYIGSAPIGGSRYTSTLERFDRVFIIAAGKSSADMIALRDKLFAIGADADDAIKAEADRRMEKFIDRVRAKAIKKIHRQFPHFFGGAS